MRGWQLWVAVAAMTASTPALAKQPGLFVRMGESVIFHIDQGQPVDPRPASESDAPGAGEIKLTLEFKSGSTMMVVTNNSQDFLNYRAFITPDPDKNGQSTSVCTLMSGGRSAFESWGGRLPGIRVSDFAKAPDGEMRCQ